MTTPEGTPLDSARTSVVTDERNVELGRAHGWTIEGPFVLEAAARGAAEDRDEALRLLGRIYGYVADRQIVGDGLMSEIRELLAADRGQ